LGLIANTIDPTFGHLAGGHTHFLEVAKRLEEFSLTVFAPAFARPFIQERLPQARFVAMPSCAQFSANTPLLFASALLTWPIRWSQLRSCRVLCATSHFLGDTLPAVFVGRRRSLIIVHHLIESASRRSGNRFRNVLAYVTERASLSLVRLFARAIVAGSEYAAERLIAEKMRQRIFVTTNGVEHHDRKELAQERKAVFLGRLHPTKGIEDLLKIWSIVARTFPDALLTIIGEGSTSYTRKLYGATAELNILRNVVFAGRVNEGEKLRLLRHAELFLFPSTEEGWGIAVAEAMAVGLPCITYDLPVYRRIFTAGRLSVPIGDTIGFSRRVIHLFSHHQRRWELATQAYELAQTFSWEKAAAAERAAIHWVLAGEVPHRPAAADNTRRAPAPLR